MKWCLKETRRLIQEKPNYDLAEKHLKKSEYNYKVLKILEKEKLYDWALNVGFYSIYHCFLAILWKYGYNSRNQSCTVVALLKLIDEKKINFNRDFVLQFDTIDIKSTLTTVRQERELSTYGVKTSINTEQLKRLKELILQIQKATVEILT